MVGDIFSDQEDQLVEQVKASAYYPEGDIRNNILGLLQAVDKERAGEIIDVAIAQIDYEQKQRRDFTLSSLNIAPDKAKTSDAEIFVRAIAQLIGSPTEFQAFINQSDIDKAIFVTTVSVTQEIIEQATMFDTVATSLEELFATTLYTERVKPILTVLQKLPPDRLESLLSLSKDYVQRVMQLGDDVIVKDPDYSNAMKEMFKLVGLSVSSEKQETIGDRLKFCSDILLTAGIISTNNKQGKPLTDEQVGLSAGLWLYNLEGAPLGEVIVGN